MYGEVLEWLRGCDYAVLPPTLPEAAIAALRRAGTQPLGYISIATLGGWEPWAKLVPSGIIIGSNPQWGEEVVDACSAPWRRVYAWALDYIASRGYAGYFLDNLDVADRYPRMKGCIASLVRLTREMHPDATIAVNRGFAILPQIAPYIDILVYEAFPTYYDPSTRSYREWHGADLQWCLERLREALRLAEEHGFTVVLLAYAPRGRAAWVCTLLEKLGVPSLPLYVAPDELQEPGVCNPCGGPEARHLPSSTAASTTPTAERRTPRAPRPSPQLLPLLMGAAAALAALFAFKRRRG